MKYFRAKKVVDELSTKQFKSANNNDDRIIHYAESDGFEYLGIESADLSALLAAQPVELEVAELTFAEIKPILDNCKMMKDFNSIIEGQIAEKYSFGRELKMRDLLVTDPERIEYEAVKESVKAPIRLKKQEFGLIV